MVSTIKIDELGRILINKALRQELDFIEGDDLTLMVSSGKLIVTKSTDNCKICNNTDNLTLVHNVGYICNFCMDNIKSSN